MQMFKFARKLAPTLIFAAVLGCSDSTGPSPVRIVDVDAARGIWTANRPSSYIFDVNISGSAGVMPYYRVTVVSGHVVSATNAKGDRVDGFDTTIDTIWDRVLSSRANQQLHTAEFDAAGVPVEVDYGRWEVDGGVHFSVRNFSIR
jgi:Family of unknown function (DUF6174)